ncbi:MAG: TonB family protein [Pseudohongiellaceae bacterium]
MYAIAQHCIRYNSATLAGALTTFALFYFMQSLIQTGEELPQQAVIFPIVDATMPEIELEIFPTIERPEPMIEPEIAEEPVDTREISPGSGPTVPVDYIPPAVELPRLQGFGLSSSAMIPLVRTVAPYPSRALERQIEGFVIVEFTVTELGAVAEPRIVYAEPEGYFERAAMQTIAKWRYAARIENGKPVSVANVQQRITFEIND